MFASNVIPTAVFPSISISSTAASTAVAVEDPAAKSVLICSLPLEEVGRVGEVVYSGKLPIATLEVPTSEPKIAPTLATKAEEALIDIFAECVSPPTETALVNVPLPKVAPVNGWGPAADIVTIFAPLSSVIFTFASLTVPSLIVTCETVPKSETVAPLKLIVEDPFAFKFLPFKLISTSLIWHLSILLSGLAPVTVAPTVSTNDHFATDPKSSTVAPAKSISGEPLNNNLVPVTFAPVRIDAEIVLIVNPPVELAETKLVTGPLSEFSFNTVTIWFVFERHCSNVLTNSTSVILVSDIAIFILT